MSAKTEATQHTLTYRGLVDPTPGTQMGPGMDGRRWSVVGSIYDTKTKTTAVTVEEIQEEA